jgi:hypothetical protein
MNICSVWTEAVHKAEMKIDASRRHSEEYFFDVLHGKHISKRCESFSSCS